MAQKTGIDLLKDAVTNGSSSIPKSSRAGLGIRGLVPTGYIPFEVNVERCINNLRSKSSPLEKYIYLQGLQDIDERLYFGVLTKHITEVMPIVYTPTVGEACQKYSTIYRGTVRGVYLSIEDLGSVREILDVCQKKVTTIVVTDGERILGLGDLGLNGMGICVGKLALYTACAGIHPDSVLPVHLDTGTNNEGNLADPYYLGLRQKKDRGEKFQSLVEEFFDAAQDKFGKNVLIQFEDFGNTTAFGLLEKFQNRACTFNDDIQGTASVALAGVIASGRITKKSMAEHTFLFSGAGEAGTGIASLIASAISIETGIPVEEARKKIHMVDSKGLVTASRIDELAHHKIDFAHELDGEPIKCLKTAVRRIRPTVIVGVSAIPKAFDQEVIEAMTEMNERPIIFALSNPTSKAECTAQEAYEWSDGKAIFASGSPFDPVTLKDGRTFVPGQGNNAYIFPGIGLGVIAAGSTKITDNDMYVAAKSLANQVSDEQIERGCLYPPLDEIREVSLQIAVDIANSAYETGVATNMPKPDDVKAACEALVYDPYASTEDIAPSAN